MKLKSNRAVAALSILSVCFPLLASAGVGRLRDDPYTFDSVKVKAADNSFHFLRSFVDLFYITFENNQANFPGISSLTSAQGWCVGDAHPENFGVLLQQDQSPLFTMNDMDDSGPCPVVLELYRLMVSSNLYDSSTKINKILEAYTLGLNHQSFPQPDSIQVMIAKATKKGISPKDSKIAKNKFIRDAQMVEVTANERDQLMSALKSYRKILDPKSRVLDLVATSKVGGGSGGLRRFEILIDNGGVLLHLEVKQEVRPAVYPVSPNIPATEQRITSTLQFVQGRNASPFYKVIQIDGSDFLIRPGFAGDVGVSLDDGTKDINKDIIRYEAYTLGIIHSHSLRNAAVWSRAVNSVNVHDIEKDVNLMSKYFDDKYKEAQKK